jgi:hypothetical protein
MSNDQMPEAFECWGILELMGHRRLGGFIRESTIGGASFIRIDVPAETDGHSPASQFYAPGAVYCITPCSEEAARAVAKANQPEPIHRWELPRPTGPGLEEFADETPEYDDEPSDEPDLGDDPDGDADPF